MKDTLKGPVYDFVEEKPMITGPSNPDLDWTSIRAVQVEITRWAEQQFPGRTDFAALAKLVLHEIPEMLVHKKERGLDQIGLELADCFILLLDLASMWQVDVAAAIREKMQVNYNRTWNRDENGIMQHIQALVTEEEIPLGFGTKSQPTVVYCPQCRSFRYTRTLRDSDPIHPDIKLGAVPQHDTFCTACKLGFDSSIPF